MVPNGCKSFIINLPCSKFNEKFPEQFIKNIDDVAIDKCKFIVVWNDRKVQSWFNIKDNFKHFSSAIYDLFIW